MKSLSLTKPHLLVAIGLPGSGKSFFAEKFAETFGAPYVCEAEIAQQAKDASACDTLFRLQLEQLLKTGQTIVIDGKAQTRVERMALTQKAKKQDYEILLIWIQTDPQTAKSRALKKNYTTDSFDKETRRFTAPSNLEKVVVVSGKHTYASQAKVVLKKLTNPRAEISTHTAPPVREPGRRNITIR